MNQKGITRKKIRDPGGDEKKFAWEYYDKKGKLITDENVIDRCNKLVLPPAWESVWISPDPEAKLQATGVDNKGRVQYRYHESWTAERALAKFDGMAGFAKILPAIRKKVDSDLKLEGMPRDKVVAVVVKLIDLYHFRVGNDEYAKKNDSYGLTTIKEGHMIIDRSESAEGELDAVLEFKGKSGKMWKRRIWEDDLALLIDASGAVGGRDNSQDLFRYEDKNGKDFDIKAYHINDYLDAITKKFGKVTAKDFRTWAASTKAAARLAKQLDPETVAARKRVATGVIKSVAEDLGNTPTVCRSSYIHPIFLKDWLEGNFRERWNDAVEHRKMKGLTKEETATLKYLEQN